MPIEKNKEKFQVGDLVRCVNLDAIFSGHSLFLGKEYIITAVGSNWVTLKDLGNVTYNVDRFEFVC